MPTNRPFFANFLAAFRAHTAISKASSTTPSQFPSTGTTLTTTASAARAISSQATSPNTNNTTIAKTPSHQQPQTAGPTTTAVQAATQSHLSHHHHAARSTPLHSPSTSPHNTHRHNHNFQRPPQRRGSDSSSDGGFRDALGGEKWFVGGRTASGEERFYRLGMVRRDRAGSLDRLSL